MWPQVAGAKVPLQRLTVMIPPGSWVGALTLVMRSTDGTMWYKDAGSNFHIPVPCLVGGRVSAASQLLPLRADAPMRALGGCAPVMQALISQAALVCACYICCLLQQCACGPFADSLALLLITLQFAPEVAADPMDGLSDELSRAIVDAEVNTHQWTLMHRCGAVLGCCCCFCHFL